MVKVFGNHENKSLNVRKSDSGMILDSNYDYWKAMAEDIKDTME